MKLISKISFLVALLMMCLPDLLSSTARSDEIRGRVTEILDGVEVPVAFVNVYWNGTEQGAVTDERGEFKIKSHSEEGHHLVVSYVGYSSDTIWIEPGQTEVSIIMVQGDEIDEVTVAKRVGGSFISKLNPILTEGITEAGLQKLPCCNLSESFENSATIDVGYSDAVTGAKHIKMLGLAGIYSQMMFENIPYLRGLESAFGLNYVPGPWMESIQISKGAAAVINGYESTTGQINIEFKKPEQSDPLFINLFANSNARFEANVTSAIKINEDWSTMIMAHASSMQNKIDRNKDGFLDVPLNRQYNFLNRWRYNQDGNLRAQFGISVMDERRDGGQLDFDYDRDLGTTNAYGININTRKYHGYGKMGVLIPSRPGTSIGFQTSGTYYDQQGFYGIRNYDAEQQSFYANLIFQSYIWNTNHMYSAGLSYQYDRFTESLDALKNDRTESVPGLFAQYTYTLPEKLNAIVGFRADQNSWFGTILTPRVHIRYNLTGHTTLRASAGKGYRSANAMAENTGVLASSRNLVFQERIRLEQAWNFGVNLVQQIHIGGHHDNTFSIDLYRTSFKNQLIVDMDQDVQAVHFYNLNGSSFANNLQAELNLTPIERFEIKLAYRFSDVKSTIDGQLREVPMVSRYKGLLTLSYATPFRKWAFDFTGQLNGQARLPDTRMNPPQYQLKDYSPSFFILHAQVSKRFKWFELYAGGENLTDFIQEKPILATDDPFGPNFDASMVWGPLLGRRFYAGIRYTFK